MGSGGLFSLEERCHLHPERPGDLAQLQDGDVAEATFQAVGVGAVDSCLSRELLLVPALRLPKGTDTSTKALEGRVWG